MASRGRRPNQEPPIEIRDFASPQEIAAVGSTFRLQTGINGDPRPAGPITQRRLGGDMMQVTSVADQLFFSTVRIETTEKDSTDYVATGFIFDIELPEGPFPCVITNAHVIRDAVAGSLTFIGERDGQPMLGERHQVPFTDFPQAWHSHPHPDVDVAATPLVPVLEWLEERGVSVFTRSLGHQLVPSSAQLAELDSIEEILFVGYPKGVWDTKNFLPLVRRGITASPISVDFEGLPKFLVDAPVFVGSSGSPVVLYNSGSYAAKTGGLVLGSRLFLLGVLGKGMHGYDTSLLEIDGESYPIRSKPMIGLGHVYKVQTVVETVKGLIERERESGRFRGE